MQPNVNTAKRFWDNLVNDVMEGLPEFIGALLIVIIGYFVSKAVATATRKLLEHIQLDQRLHSGSGGKAIQRAIPNPTKLLARVVFWILFFLAITIAISVLGIPLLEDFVRSIYGYLPNVFAALLIFVVAGAISTGIATLVLNTMGDTPTGKAVASIGPVLVMGIAIFMILNQLKIAPQIVTITYAALIGSFALGGALAFGLGGRETAAKIVNDFYEKGQNYKNTAASDVQKGIQEGKRKAKKQSQ